MRIWKTLALLIAFDLCHMAFAQDLPEAISKGDTAKAKELIAHGANVRAESEDDGSTPLYYAVYYNNAEIVKLLLAHKADPNVGKTGITPLSISAGEGYLDIAKMLLAAGADVNGKSLYGITALGRACAKDRLEMAKLLIENKADPNAGKGVLGTPLHDAAASGDVELLKLLIAAGANVSAADIDGKKARDVAQFYQKTEAVAYLDSIPAPTPLAQDTEKQETVTYNADGLVFTFLAPAGWKKVESGRLPNNAIYLMSPKRKQGCPTLLITSSTEIPKGWSLEYHMKMNDEVVTDRMLNVESKDAVTQTIDGYKSIGWVTTFNIPGAIATVPGGTKVCQYNATVRIGGHILDFTLQSGETDFPTVLEPGKAAIKTIKVKKH